MVEFGGGTNVGTKASLWSLICEVLVVQMRTKSGRKNSVGARVHAEFFFFRRVKILPQTNKVRVLLISVFSFFMTSL